MKIKKLKTGVIDKYQWKLRTLDAELCDTGSIAYTSAALVLQNQNFNMLIIDDVRYSSSTVSKSDWFKD